jgi:hypothetical protein
LGAQPNPAGGDGRAVDFAPDLQQVPDGEVGQGVETVKLGVDRDNYLVKRRGDIEDETIERERGQNPFEGLIVLDGGKSMAYLDLG